MDITIDEFSLFGILQFMRFDVLPDRMDDRLTSAIGQ